MLDSKMKLRTYNAGPMRGIDDLNRPEFYAAEESLVKAGAFDPINPARMDEESGMSDDELVGRDGLRSAMKRDLDALLECDAIFMLSGWEKSEGSRVEHSLASMLDLAIFYQ